MVATIGVDPSIGHTGWALAVCPVSNPSNIHILESDVFCDVGGSNSNRLGYLYRSMFEITYQVKSQILAHNRTVKKVFKPVELLGAGLEIPAYHGGGNLRFSRDMTLREAIGATRAALNLNGLYIVGDHKICDKKNPKGKEKPIRPGTVHALAGAFKSENKKEDVRNWVLEHAKVWTTFESFDASDAAAIAIIALEKIPEELREDKKESV